MKGNNSRELEARKKEMNDPFLIYDSSVQISLRIIGLWWIQNVKIWNTAGCCLGIFRENTSYC